MFGQSKALNRIAVSITAEDICTPFAFTFNSGDAREYAEEVWNSFCADNESDPFDYLALVVQAKEPIGGLAYDSFMAAETTVEEAMDRISVSNLVSADTPLIETA